MNMKIAYFQADATPPVNENILLCFGNVKEFVRIVDPLSARGIVILTDELPVVLCAVDWTGIANESHREWREKLAEAAGTVPERVCVHTLHQHDAPAMDRGAYKILAEKGYPWVMENIKFEDEVIKSTTDALRKSMSSAKEFTHISIGKAEVKKFASNRRILGTDGKVQYVRYSSCQDENIRNQSEGTIDPYVRNLCFCDGEKPLVSLTYYATHPQSFYHRGSVSSDTVGLARYLREAMEAEVQHIHFCGAGGNIGAGKYNDASPENRFKLAERLAKGMRDAWDTSVKIPVSSSDFSWKTQTVKLPVQEKYNDFEKNIMDAVEEADSFQKKAMEVRRLSYLRNREKGKGIDISCMKIGPVSVLHMPGELFVEYQMAAQNMLPGEMVCMAAYGEYGPSYIGTAESYSQDGYEVRVNLGCHVPEVEKCLMDAIKKLL